MTSSNGWLPKTWWRKVIRNHETQESKGFAFVEAPTPDEMQAIIRRFDRAPLEDRLLRANPAQPPKGKDARGATPTPAPAAASSAPPAQQRPPRRKRGGKDRDRAPRSAFATELAKVL
jgi:RNA recognition motif-containing protein